MITHRPITIPIDHFPIKWSNWNVSIGNFIEKGTLLGCYSSEGKEFLLKSEFSGELLSFAISVGEEWKSSRPIGILKEVCSHSVQLHGLCAICGSDVSQDEKATINLTHDARGITLSANEAERIEKETKERLLKQKKLSLILDLDQTLIHATVDIKIRKILDDSKSKVEDICTFCLPCSPMEYHIKLRPGTREFLREMDKKYEMHIYTMGTRSYAIEIAKILDPDQSLFKERILSRDESGSFSVKSIKRLFPCDQSMVVVVDDRSDIWGWSPNLIHVNPYNFFEGIGDINAPKPISVQENEAESSEGKDIEHSSSSGTTLVASEESSGSSTGQIMRADDDIELSRVTWMLNEIYGIFYDSYANGSSPDVGEILPGLKRNVLKNVKIVFSGIIPLGVDPTKEFIWKKAAEFGAQISNTVDQSVTHVVANKKGTLKLNQAKKIPGVLIVKPDWLHDSLAKWKRQDEAKYILEENVSSSQKLLVRIDETGDSNVLEQVDAHDFEILSAKPEGPLFSHLAKDDLLEMDREVDEAMNEGDSEFDSIENEIDEGLDELFSAENEVFPELSGEKRKRSQYDETTDDR